jgi:SAM-dependent methyltransferase
MALDSRDRWARAAAGWSERADWFRAATMPVSAWMLDALAPQPGHTILELAAGIGDVGFLAAELIAPGGELISTDFVPEMLTAAQRRAERLGIENVRFRQMDANLPLDQPAASLDAVLCRWGYMLLDDGEAALQETRRVLRPGGRVALAAWAGADENRWSSAPTRVFVEQGAVEPTPPGPSQFAWAAEGAVAGHMEAAGFIDPEVESLDLVFRFADLDEWWAHVIKTSTRAADANDAMDFATRSDVLAALDEIGSEFEQPDGSLAIPARTWVAAATA